MKTRIGEPAVASALITLMGLAALSLAQTPAKTSTTGGASLNSNNNKSAQNKAVAQQQAQKLAVPDLKPTIDNGQHNQAVISTRPLEGKDWLQFSLKTGSPKLYCGSVWILPATSDGGEWTNARGDQYFYKPEGVYLGPHLQLLPGAVAIDNNDAGYTGFLDFSDSEYTFLGNVNLKHIVFSSAEKAPLVFKLVKDVGAVYVSGNGTVTTEEGKELLRIPSLPAKRLVK